MAAPVSVAATGILSLLACEKRYTPTGLALLPVDRSLVIM